MNKRISVVQLGARMHYAVPRILYNSGMLEYLYTDTYLKKKYKSLLEPISGKILPKSIQRFRSRKIDGIDERFIKSSLFFGLHYALKRARAKDRAEAIDVKIWASKKIADRISSKDLKNLDAIYAYNGAALETFLKAKYYGVACILEQTSATYIKEKELLDIEANNHPDWIVSKDNYNRSMKYREMREFELADFIICGSDFVRKSIAETSARLDKCKVIPYGVNNVKSIDSGLNKEANDPIRVLTVGQVSYRKGSQYVLKAAKLLKDEAHFRMVGSINVPDNIKRNLEEHVDLTGVVPRNLVNEHYKWADVFLLPSISEGSATVVYEAILHGLPVICTNNTGSIIRDGKEGFIVELGDVEDIKDKILLLKSNDTTYKNMSKNCLELFKNKGNFDSYSKRLIDFISKNIK
jgi:glycosyltransferase involved in cell wall biosynthesis